MERFNNLVPCYLGKDVYHSANVMVLSRHHRTFPFRQYRDSQAIPVAHEFPGFVFFAKVIAKNKTMIKQNELHSETNLKNLFPIA